MFILLSTAGADRNSLVMSVEELTFPEYTTNPNGGDVSTTNLNLYYNKGDLTWILVASLVCLLIAPVCNLSA